MNSHIIEKDKKSFSNDISELLSNKYIESEHLNFRSLVGIFFVYPDEEDGNTEADIETFVQVLNEGCFDVLSYFECSLPKLSDKLIEKKIFSYKQPVAKEKFEALHTFIIGMLRAEKEIAAEDSD
jgi:hypothetical protein